MKGKLKILLADDHAVVRHGMRQLIANHPGMEVVGEAADGGEVVPKAKKLLPDVILLDISMPRLNGLEVVPLLKEAVPDSKVVIFSMYDKDAYVHQALASGAVGFVLKTDSGDEVIAAILRAATGHYYLSPKLNTAVIRRYLFPTPVEDPAVTGYDSLSEREQQIFRMVVEGHPTKEIATMLYLSPRTVEKHRSNIVKKLDIHEPMALVRYAVKIGVVDPELWSRTEC
ncbi:MAG: response regulator transcription factor [Desulfobulbaceae bacterium]|nr:response regulator transcription factor [Desulfobulbaceae bacterium]HIJ89500.1 response regulator transcription factor [Deltaproteobacteria bacterium]